MSERIMSTNLPGEFRFGETPDPLNLARLANEFFAAVSSGRIAPVGAGVPAVPMNPVPVPPTGIGVAAPSVPGVPVFVDSAAGDPGPAFLKDVRPRYAGPEEAQADLEAFLKSPGAGALTVPPPWSSGVGELAAPSATAPNNESGAAVAALTAPFVTAPDTSVLTATFDPPRADDSTQAVPTPPMPTFPGGLDSTAMPTFSFLEEARPLFSHPPAIPGPVSATSPSQTQPAALTLSSDLFDAHTLKRDFPVLREQVNGRPLVWLDNAATTQKPQSVIDRLSYFYEHENSNVHRAAHEMAARATDAYESAREKVRRFLNASTVREIIFVRGATEGINLVAQSWGRRYVEKDDEIVITWLEHHANIVPWQALCSEKGARLRVAPVDDSGQVILEEYEKLLNSRTRLVSIAQVSNALGTVTPLPEMIAAAHRWGAKVLVDGAQSVSHMRVDMQALDCDFFVLSGHKMFAPTGIGVVYGKSDVLETMPPWQGGGNMIQDVTFEKTLYQPPPARFEAGTGNIADAVGLGAAIDYLDRVGMANVGRYEHELLVYGTAALEEVPGLHLIGTAAEKAGVLSFVLDGVRTEEIGDLLNREGIAVRSGHHCAQPILRRFGLESTVRASLALYNTCSDIDALTAALRRIQTAKSGRRL
jgi:cysteine desulfurase/selenocysteine lyase